MGNYLKQVKATKSLLNGKKFPQMYDAVMTVANKGQWDHFSAVNDIRKTKDFSGMCKTMGISLIYEGNDSFTVNVDGAHQSAFLIPMVNAITPFMNNGEVVVRVGNRNITTTFKDGQSYMA